MNTIPSNPNDKEISFSDISKSVGSMFSRMSKFIYTSIQFVIRNIVILLLLIVIGAGLGYYLDKTSRVYQHQIIVSPNFGSVDYLYSSIDLVNSKIRERDSVFLKSIGVTKPLKLIKIEIEPVIDVYKFVNRSGNEIDFQMLKLMAENGDVKKIVEDPTTSRNYTSHSITFLTKGRTSRDATIEPLIKYLNSNTFYKQLQDQTLKNVAMKMQANTQTIAQIDGFLDELAKNDATASKTSAVYVNENRQLNDVIETKDDLLQEQAYLRIELVSYDKIIKENTVITNIEHKSSVNGNYKIWLPLLLILFYILIIFAASFYKAQKIKYTPVA